MQTMSNMIDQKVKWSNLFDITNQLSDAVDYGIQALSQEHWWKPSV